MPSGNRRNSRRSLADNGGLIENYHKVLLILKKADELSLKKRFENDEDLRANSNKGVTLKLAEVAMTIAEEMKKSMNKSQSQNIESDNYVEKFRKGEEGWKNLNKENDYFKPFKWDSPVDMCEKDKEFIEKKCNLEPSECLKDNNLNKMFDKLEESMNKVNEVQKESDEDMKEVCAHVHKIFFRNITDIFNDVL